MRLLALALAASVLAACSADVPAPAGQSPAVASSAAPADGLAAHTPADLRHPCRAVPARAAGRALGEKVSARERTSALAPRTLTCSYVPDEQDRDAPSLEIQSTPDPTSLDAMLRLYLGADRLQHHPVEVEGADDAEVVLQPDDDLVALFAKQGFVTHSVVLRLDDLERGELIAVRLALLVVRGNH